MSELIMLTINASVGTFLTVALILAVFNFLGSVMFTAAGQKARFRGGVTTSVIAMIAFTALLMFNGKLGLVGDSRATIELGIIAVAAIYAIITVICAMSRLGDPDKVNKSFRIFLTMLAWAGVFFMVFTILREYDLVKFADELIILTQTGKFASLANIEGALSNSLVLGLLISMAAIAAIGVLCMLLLNLWKTDKYKFSLMVAVILIVAYMALPVYSVNYLITPTDSIKEFPDKISISGLALILGLVEGISPNYILMGISFVGIAGFFICQAKEYKREEPSIPLRVVKAIFLLLVAVAMLFTNAFATAGFSPAFAKKVNYIINFTISNNLQGDAGVAGIVSTLGIILAITAIFSIRKPFIHFLQRYRYITVSAFAVVGLLMFISSPIYVIPGFYRWTGMGLIFGLSGVSSMNILLVIALVTAFFGIIFGFLANANDEYLCKFFRRIAAFLLMITGVVLLLGQTTVDFALTDNAKTVATLMRAIGWEVKVASEMTIAGLLFVLASVVMVIRGWINFFKGAVKFLREGVGSKIFGIFGGVVVVVLYALLVLSGTIETQILEGSKTIISEYSIMDILMGSNVPAGTFGLVTRIALIALGVITVFGALFMILGDIAPKKKMKFHTLGFVCEFISGVVLLILTAITAMMIKDGIAIYSISYALIGFGVLAVAFITTFSAAINVVKKVCSFFVENVGITVTLISLVFIVLYILGIL